MRVLVAGGGVGGLELILALRELAGDRVDMTLLEPQTDFVYRPLSVREPFGGGAAERHPLDRIAGELDFEIRYDLLDHVDPSARLAVTGGGQQVEYDALVVTLGAARVPAWPRVLTFRDETDAEAVHGLVQDVEAGYTRRIAFVVPPGITWTLPLYELALMTAQRIWESSLETSLTLITPEPAPLAVFGDRASRAVGELLAAAKVSVETSAYADVPRGGEVVLRPDERRMTFERIVALPLLRGRQVDGLPSDEHGFIHVDEQCAVIGADDVWAAGDGTHFPIKQGGIATQQADAIATVLAARAGADVDPQPFEPILRGKLLTGDKDRFLRADPRGGHGETSEASAVPLWWPPGKIAGKYLAPYLAGSTGAPADADGVEVEVPLNDAEVRRLLTLVPDEHGFRAERLG